MFFVVNLLTLAGTGLLVQQDRRETRRILASTNAYFRQQEERSRGSLDPDLRDSLSRWIFEIESCLAAVPRQDVLTAQDWLVDAEALWSLALWRDPFLLRQVVEVVLLRRDPRTNYHQVLNVPGHLMASFDVHGRTRDEVSSLIDDARRVFSPVIRKNRVGAALRVHGDDWGGVWFRLRDIPNPLGEVEQRGSALFLSILVLIPVMVFLLFSMWRLLEGRVLAPMEQLGNVASAVASGDYSRRLQADGADEVADMMRSFNEMMELVQDYRNTLEARVIEKTGELEAKNRELLLAQRLAAMGTLAAGIAHEINNPLGGMLNVARRIDRDDLDPQKRLQYRQMLEEGIERIGSIVRRLLDVSPRRMTPSPVDVEKELDKAMALTRHRAESKGVRMESQIESGLPPVLGESNELGQVFLNLLINAVDASDPGSVVTARLFRGGPGIVAEIEDRGDGMDEEVKNRAFDLFFTTKSTGEGTGLGLAMVHHIVEAHGGSLSLASEKGSGTVVRIEFPASGGAGELLRPGGEPPGEG